MSTETIHMVKKNTPGAEPVEVPELRFKEFDGEWQIISNSIQIVAGNSYSLDDYLDKGVVLIQGLNIGPGKLKLDNPYYLSDTINGSHITLNKDDILLGLNRPITNGELKICKYDLNQKAYLYQRAGKLEFNTNEIHSEFLYQLLRSDYFLKKTTIELVGSDQPYIRSNLFKVVKLWFPEFPEQQKIASFLSAVDKKIQQLTKKKELLEHYKKGVMQQLFSGKLRFKPDGVAGPSRSYPDWEEKQLSEVAERVTRKNKENNLNVLTISAQLGLVSQLEYFNKSVSAANVTNYYLLNRNDFAYNKSYSNGYPMGAIKRLKKYDKGVVSTLYICFAFNEKVSLEFMEQYFEFGRQNVELEKVAQEGARNHGLLNIGVKDFFNIDIKIPTLPEQQKIATYLSSIDTKIESVNQQITQTQTFKRGLLQKMFV